jgi:CRISPR-associated protein Csm2
MSYGQQHPQAGGQRGFDRNERAPAPMIDVSDIKFGTGMPDQLFADIAQDKARVIAEAGAGRKNKSTQLRKFYDELVMWHDKVAFEQSSDAKAVKYKELAPFVKMLNAKVAYARGRDHVDLCFEKLFTHVIRQIDAPDTLKHAKLFMEAFMGFYKAEEK